MISEEPLATIRIDEDTGRITLTWPDKTSVKLCRWERLQAARRTVDDILEKFRLAVPLLVPPLADVDSALRDLTWETEKLANRLADDDAGLLAEIESRLRAGFPQWDAPGDVVKVIQVIGEDYFPFELLPLFERDDVPMLGNRTQAEDVMCRFLGYAVAIRREGGFSTTTAPLRRGAEGVPVQFLRYTLRGAEQEEIFLDESRPHLHLDGPWPPVELDDADAVIDALVHSLYDPAQALTHPPLDVPVQIQHFACHCDTKPDDPDDYALLLGDEPGHRVTYGRIWRGVNGHERNRRYLDARPLVFLNACGSGRIDPTAFRSFPKWFLKNRFRAFVGTEVDVPDNVAAHYATMFYEAMLEGRPLAEAVVVARRGLMQVFGNPLGLLYVMYGDPALSLER